MKKLLVFLSILVLSFSLFAGTAKDLAFSFGMGNNDWSGEGISFSYGMSMGLTKRLELDLSGISRLTPEPFSGNTFFLEVGYSLQGDRNTGTRVSGAMINTLVTLGAFWNPWDESYGPVVGIAPLTFGTPSTSRRERFLKTEVGYDLGARKVMVALSLLEVDLYLKGTYREWTR